MLFIRPASADDLDQLLALAAGAGVGLTTLPRDRDLLERRILKSQRSFEQIADRPGVESYLFVMEDSNTGRLAGASGIVSKVGGFEPFYGFRIEKEIHVCDFLGVRTEVPYLHQVREHDGPAEIGSLYLAPGYRGKDIGRFLQLVRFLFVAEHPAAFEKLIVSELRGVIDAAGRSPFWDAVGRHFFDIDFPRADYLSVVNKKFIADLMPTHSIYVPLLPPEARQVIGQVHEESKPALKNLEAEGFRFCDMVDIFDAGPCLSCATASIRTVRESRLAVIAEVTAQEPSSLPFMIATSGREFRASMGAVASVGGSVRVDAASARVLGVGKGDRVRFAPIRPAGLGRETLTEMKSCEAKDGAD